MLRSADRSTSNGSVWVGERSVPETMNRYQALIEKVFFDHFTEGASEFGV